MDRKNNSRGHNITKKQNGRRNQLIGKDMTKQNKEERDSSRIEERTWSIIGRQWNCLCGWMNLHS